MPDRKPPRLIAGERETLMALLNYQRESLAGKLAGLDRTEAEFSPVHTGTSLLWLIKHLTSAEETWIVRRFAGEESPALDPVVEDESVDAVVARYRAQWARSDSIVESASLDDQSRDTGSESPVTLRWILMHLLEETARHAGHADIIRELIDGATGR